MVHVPKCPFNVRGIPTTEFYADGKPQIYCFGYIDSETDEYLEECKKCLDWVYGEQCQNDYKTHVKEGR